MKENKKAIRMPTDKYFNGLKDNVKGNKVCSAEFRKLKKKS